MADAVLVALAVAGIPGVAQAGLVFRFSAGIIAIIVFDAAFVASATDYVVNAKVGAAMRVLDAKVLVVKRRAGAWAVGTAGSPAERAAGY